MCKDERCPICGNLEKRLLLEETGGWFECSKCGAEINLMKMEGGIDQVSVRKQGMPQKVGCTCPKCGAKQLLYDEEIKENRCKCYQCGNEFEIAILYGIALPVLNVG